MKTLALFVFAVLIPTSAFAQNPRIGELLWDSCSGHDDFKSYAGPGVYRQVVTGLYFDAPVQAHEVRIRVLGSNVFGGSEEPVPDAWRFDDAGCEAGRAHLDANHAEPGCPALASPGATSTLSSLFVGNSVLLIYDCNYSVQDPSFSTVYSLFGIDFDLSSALPGPQNAPYCGNAEKQVCFVLEGGAWTDAVGQAHPLDFLYFSGIAWQNFGGCFGDLPTKPSTWGRVRALYR